MGEGGNGEVWRAVDESGQVAALKVLRDNRPTKVPFARFSREVSVVEGLGEFPGVLPIIDSKVPENPGRREKVWYAMPVAEKLRVHLEVASVEEVVGAVRDLSQTLVDLAEQNQIAHRDLKPENLFWWEGRAALSDFGLVHVPELDSLTDSDRVPGSFGYIADEVMRGLDGIDYHLADVFSQAKVLWVLLLPSNRFPPQGSLRADHGPSSLARELLIPESHDLDRILEAATRDRDQRIDMKTFVAELDAWLAAPREAAGAEGLEAAIAAARQSIEPDLQQRSEEQRRSAEAYESFGRLQEAVEPIVEVLLRIDPEAEVGPGAIGNLYQWIEQGEYMGGPTVTERHHHGVRLTRSRQGSGVILIAAFVLELLDDGEAQIAGLLLTGFEEVFGPGTEELLERRSAQVGSVQLDREISELAVEAQEKLPKIIEAFSQLN